jgi:CheY-like chemotaxis protein
MDEADQEHDLSEKIRGVLRRFRFRTLNQGLIGEMSETLNRELASFLGQDRTIRLSQDAGRIVVAIEENASSGPSPEAQGAPRADVGDSPEPPAQPKARILVVEDDPIFNDMVVKVVRRSGYEAIAAHTGEQALSLLREWNGRIDWLLTDIRLPGEVDGWVVSSEFSLKHPLRPVVYVSGVEEDSSTRRVAGSIFLKKPVQVPELMATFHHLNAAYQANLRQFTSRDAPE